MQVLNIVCFWCQDVINCLEPFLMYLAPYLWQQLQKMLRNSKSAALITPLYWCTKTFTTWSFLSYSGRNPENNFQALASFRLFHKTLWINQKAEGWCWFHSWQVFSVQQTVIWGQMQPELHWAWKKVGRNLPFDYLLVTLPVVECSK